jgi:hypothetical protein
MLNPFPESNFFYKTFDITHYEIVTIWITAGSARVDGIVRVKFSFSIAPGRQPSDLRLYIGGPYRIKHTLDTLVAHLQHMRNNLQRL